MKRSLRMFLMLGAGFVLAVPTSSPVWAQQPGGEAEEQAGIRLALDDSLRMALKNNLDLVSARYGPRLAEQTIEIRRADFDPTFSASYSHSEQTSLPRTSFDLTDFQGDEFTPAEFSQLLKFGGSYDAKLTLDKSVRAGTLVTSDTSYDSRVSLSFTQPLLKGFGVEVTTEQLILARNDLQISRLDLERRAETTIESVEGAYWDVVAAREALRIATLSLKRAQDLLSLNRKKVEVGTLAPIEITQADAGVASQEEGVIVAETRLGDAEDELRRQLAIPQSDPMWDTRILPTDLPEPEPQLFDLEGAMATALEARPELESARETLRSRELSERVARQRVRHQLDLSASYAPKGSSPQVNAGPDGVLGTVDDSFSKAALGEAFSNTTTLDEYSWSASLTYRVPLGNRAAQATYAQASLAREQSASDLANTEQTIRVDVRRAVRGVESGYKRVLAARSNVTLQRAKLDAEQKKFENGMSTSFEVLTFQNDLATAELALVNASLDYAKSLAALERAKGTLLEARGLSIAER